MRSEETQPFTSAPPRRVAEAYKSGGTSSLFKTHQCGVLALAFIMLLMIMGSGGGHDEIEPDSAKNLRLPEQQPGVVAPQPNPILDADNQFQENYDDHDDDKVYQEEMAEEVLEIEVETAMDEMDEAEEEEIEINDSMLISAVKSVEDNLKYYLGKVFGSGEDIAEEDDDDVTSEDTSADVKLTGEQLDAITQEISEKLEKEVKTEFRTKADEIAEEKITEIDQMIAEDRDAGLDADEIAEDVVEAERAVEEDLKDEIDEAAKKVKDEIPDKVKKIRNEVVEKFTGKKLDDIVERQKAKAHKQKEMIKQLKKEYDMKQKAAEQKATVKSEINAESETKYEIKQNTDDSKKEASVTEPIEKEEGEELVSDGKEANFVNIDADRPDRQPDATIENTEKSPTNEQPVALEKVEKQEEIPGIAHTTEDLTGEQPLRVQEEVVTDDADINDNETVTELVREDEEDADDDEK